MVNSVFEQEHGMHKSAGEQTAPQATTKHTRARKHQNVVHVLAAHDQSRGAVLQATTPARLHQWAKRPVTRWHVEIASERRERFTSVWLDQTVDARKGG